jgi:hypothetical protein
VSIREQLRSRTLTPEDYNRIILRIVYRLLFWFILEDRGFLPDPKAPASARARYTAWFSARRLREHAQRQDSPHPDLWGSITTIFVALGNPGDLPSLALPRIGGLFDRIGPGIQPNLQQSYPDELDEPLEQAFLANEDLLAAVRLLALDEISGESVLFDFSELDLEDLGGSYESLLALTPRYDPTGPTFTLIASAGNERKTSGSYYTPRSLVDALLDSTLEPLLDQAMRSADSVPAATSALLDLTVCDPACGTGHFLIGAAARISQRLARLRAGTESPAAHLVRAAMREVIGRCIYGVDINEMATELTKFSLWLESAEPGCPPASFEENIRVGNALLGATPALLEQGLPGAAVKTPAGRPVHGYAESTGDAWDVSPARLSDLLVQRKRQREIGDEQARNRLAADFWCATFLRETTPKTAAAMNHHALQTVGTNQGDVPDSWHSHIEHVTRVHRLFHWHLEFPHIFQSGGGFSCVLGNPPWERIKIQEQEFFAARRPGIARARNAAVRRRMIQELVNSTDPADHQVYATFTHELRRAMAQIRLIRDSGRYPLTARGDINTYAVFADLGRSLLSPHGRVGMVLPTGIATDVSTRHFLHDLVTTRTLVSLYDFENEDNIFPSVHHSYRFCLWTGSGREDQHTSIELAFRLRSTRQIEHRRFPLRPDDLSVLNPNTATCPVFDDRRDARIVLGIYQRVPVLWRDRPEVNPWRLSFLRMLDMATDSGLFRDRDSLETNGWELHGNVFLRASRETEPNERMLPLYEAKMVHHFDHRFGDYQGQSRSQANAGTLPRPASTRKNDPGFTVLPRYWVSEKAVLDRMRGRDQDEGWLLGWRDICRSSDARTLVVTAIPRSAVGHKFLLALTAEHDAVLLQANLSSFVVDYCARQKIVGTCLSYSTLKQLPVLPLDHYRRACPWDPGKSLADWVRSRALELTYTSYDMEGFARHHCEMGPPFRWNDRRRHLLRAELDAAYFHLYGVSGEDLEHIMGTFRAFRNRYPDRFASTKSAIQRAYRAMAHAIRTGDVYQTIVRPAPGRGPRHSARS